MYIHMHSITSYAQHDDHSTTSTACIYIYSIVRRGHRPRTDKTHKPHKKAITDHTKIQNQTTNHKHKIKRKAHKKIITDHAIYNHKHIKMEAETTKKRQYKLRRKYNHKQCKKKDNRNHATTNKIQQ